MRVFSLYRNSNAEEDVRFWHLADIDADAEDVRF
jgi:hypothetical protein